MKIHLRRESLSDALTFVAMAAPPTGAVLLEASDDELMLRCASDDRWHSAIVAADIDAPETVTVSARTITDLVRSLSSSDVELVVDGGSLTMRGGRSRYTLRLFDEFVQQQLQRAPEHGETRAVASLRLLQQATRSAAQATADTPETLLGVRLLGDEMSQLLVFGTTRYNVHAEYVPVVSGGDVDALPFGRALSDGLAQLDGDDVTISQTDNTISFVGTSRSMTLRLFDADKYIDHNRVLVEPKVAATATIDTDEATAAIKRLSLVDGSHDLPIDVVIEPHQVVFELPGGDAGDGYEIVDAETSDDANGSTLVMPQRLVLALSTLRAERAELAVAVESRRPLLLRPADDDATTRRMHVLAPIRKK